VKLLIDENLSPRLAGFLLENYLSVIQDVEKSADIAFLELD